MAGAYVVVAAGVESVSRVPLGSSRPATRGERTAARYPGGLVNQGVSAEFGAERWKLDREALDTFSAESHRRASVAIDAGDFDAEIIPVPLPGGREHARDETVRGATTAEGLADLRIFPHR